MEELEETQAISLKVLGFLYLRLGFFDRAARLFRALRSFLPEDAGIHLSLSAALLENGEAEEALALLDAPPFVPSPATNPVLLLLKARALWRLRRNEEACTVMDAYLAGAAR
ncbi:MAG: tetratricopeptide repeat protein [Zoogloeaceae bacterium]|jgi:tetratricopeptide (TPR) repeat protein|nr:tetratricopeptide repeat protein [Zoogloeaceae bacterium]